MKTLHWRVLTQTGFRWDSIEIPEDMTPRQVWDDIRRTNPGHKDKPHWTNSTFHGKCAI